MGGGHADIGLENVKDTGHKKSSKRVLNQAKEVGFLSCRHRVIRGLK